MGTQEEMERSTKIHKDSTRRSNELYEAVRDDMRGRHEEAMERFDQEVEEALKADE